MKLEKVESAIGYTFKDKSLLKRALTLASVSDDNNQLLEFFGDAILEFIVSEKIFSEGGNEGTLTERRKNLVSDSALAPVSERLGLDKLLIRGKNDVNNKKAIPSAYEALVAAVYLDGGMTAAKNLVLSTIDFSDTNSVVNFKGELQEILQGEGEILPEYECADIGTPQRHRFKVTLKAFSKTFYGEADRKTDAEQLAAKSAVKYYQSNNMPQKF